MPKKTPVAEIQEPTSLRRSPRLLQLKHSSQTLIPYSDNTPSGNSKNGPTNRAIQSMRTPQNVSRNRENCAKSANGLRNYAKSGNGSTRKSSLRGGIEGTNDVASVVDNGSRNHVKSANGSRRKSSLGIEGERRSSRLRNEVTSSVDDHMLGNVGITDMSVYSNARRIRNSEQVSIVGIDFPVTPIGIGEKKSSNCYESSGSLVLSSGDSARRVTRSCSMKMGGNVENREIENGKLKGSQLIGTRAGRGELRKCDRLVGGAIANGNRIGKDSGEGVHRTVVCGLEKVRFDPSSPCLSPGVRRGRINRHDDVDGMTDDSCQQIVERRITRSASKRIESELCRENMDRAITNVSAKKIPRKKDSRKAKKTEREKRVKQSMITSFSDRCEGESSEQNGEKLKSSNSDVMLGPKSIGVKRKRNQAGLPGKDQGWTNEQEAALQRAYFAAKPSPNFWKKVSKLVPGKSSQECFDKVNSANLTPLSTRPSSRLKKHISPSELLLTSDELLKSPPLQTKKRGKSKPKSHVARRNVRHLLQKYCQDSQADLFSILEPSENLAGENMKLKAGELTPLQSLGSPGSSSGHMKRLSRFSGIPQSPPVLKRVKNMNLHEKYIDQLHVREGKRKTVSSRYSKLVECQKDEIQNSAHRKNAVKAAKDALVSDARDVIEKFRDSQTNLMDADSDSEEVLVSDDDDDDVA